ncbi:MAG: hypothetical protein KF873_19060 [Gemmataceae bacterium]|nr:hypothetical protein [Gemmataceae bacterium]
MNARVLLIAVAALVVPTASAADKKPAALRDFPFWSAPKQPHARAFVPGLNAVLGITTDQAEKIEAACRETIDQPEARVKGSGGKAVEKAHQLVAEILTAEQKKKIETINALYAEVLAATAKEFQGDFIDAKGNDEETKRIRERQAEAIREGFQEKLATVLSKDEIKAVKAAAELEAKRAAAAKDKPKK